MDELSWFRLAVPPTLGVLAVALAATVGSRPHRVAFLGWFLGGCLVLLGAQFLEVSSTSERDVLFWSHVAYTAIALIPVFWLYFAWELVDGRQPRRRARLPLFLLVPALTVFFSWSDSLRPWIWARQALEPVGGVLLHRVLAYGPWFVVHAAYSYGLYLAGLAILVWEYLHHHQVYRDRALLILAGVTLPVVLNLAYVFRLFGPVLKDYSALTLAFSGLCFTFGMKRQFLGFLHPIRRDLLLDSLDQGLLVLDTQGRSVDANRRAVDLLGARGLQPLGLRFQDLFPGVDFEAVRGGLSWKGPLGSGGLEVEGQCRPVANPRHPDALGWLVTFQERQPAPEPLSRKEREVFALVNQGFSNKEIAARLSVSEATVKTHVHHILHKHGVGRRDDLRDWSDPPPPAGSSSSIP